MLLPLQPSPPHPTGSSGGLTIKVIYLIEAVLNRANLQLCPARPPGFIPWRLETAEAYRTRSLYQDSTCPSASYNKVINQLKLEPRLTPCHQLLDIADLLAL